MIYIKDLRIQKYIKDFKEKLVVEFNSLRINKMIMIKLS